MLSTSALKSGMRCGNRRSDWKDGKEDLARKIPLDLAEVQVHSLKNTSALIRHEVPIGSSQLYATVRVR